MPDVGIKLSMQSNIPQIAKESSDALRGISDTAQEMREAFELGDLEQKYKQFADRVDKLYDVQRTNREEIKREQDRGGGIAGPLGGMGQLATTAGGAIGRLGAGGDVVGAGVDVAGKLKGMAAGIPIAGGLIGAGIAALAGVAFAGNMLVKQYEQVMSSVIGLTASLGRFGKTSEETSKNFQKIMEEVGDSAAKFGMSLEEGTAIYRQLITAGAGAGVGGAAGDVMAYALGYGTGPDVIGKYAGLGMRFGQGTGLGMAAGGLQQAGMTRGLFDEYLQAQMQIFEEGLSRGIVKGFGEINVMSTWIAQLGDAFKGQYGVQLYRSMESAMVGATSLQSERDVLLYRATLRRMRQEGPPEVDITYQDVMRRMEDKGITPAIFMSLKALIEETAGGNEADRIEMMRMAFGVNYSTATKLVRAQTGEEAIRVLPPGAAMMVDTPEIRLMKAQNEIMNDIRTAAAELVPIKAAIVEGAGNVVSTLLDLFGVGPTREDAKILREEREVSLRPLAGLIAAGAKGRAGFPLPIHLLDAGEEMTRTLARAAAGGPGQEAALGIMETMGRIPDVMTGRWREFPKRLVDELIGTPGRPGVMSVRSPGGVGIVTGELNEFLDGLTRLVENMDKTVDKAGKLEIGITEESVPFQAQPQWDRPR